MFMESWEEIYSCVGSPWDWVLGEFTPRTNGDGVDWKLDAVVGNVGDSIALGDVVTVASEEGVC